MSPLDKDHPVVPFIESFHDFAAREHDSLAWVWDRLIPAGSLALLAGMPKSGKTFLAFGLAAAISTGQTFLGRATLDGPVIYVLEEGAARGIAERIRKFESQLGNLINVYVIHRKGVRTDDRDLWDQLKKQIARINPVLVILDPFAFLHDAPDENHATGMVPVMRRISTLVSPRCSVLLIHHTTKAGADGGGFTPTKSARGSSAIIGATDANLVLSKRDRKGNTLRLESEMRDAESDRIEIAFDGSRGTFNVIDAEDDPSDDGNLVAGYPAAVQPTALLALARETAEQSAGAGLTSSTVAQTLSVSEETARKGLTAGKESGLFTCEKEGQTNVYRVAA